jgi:hypothetical protein
MCYFLPKFPPATGILAILDAKFQKKFACGGQFLYSIFLNFYDRIDP